MSKEENITKENSPTRRKIVWGLGILSTFTAFSAATGLRFFGKKNSLLNKPENKKRTVKMLTQDGRLVEIDEALITANRKKVTNTEMQHWIKK